MSSSPEAVFQEAQMAVENKDWERFFACLDRNDLLRIASNSVMLSLRPGNKGKNRFRAICTDYNFPLETIEAAWQSPKDYKTSLNTALKSIQNLAQFVAALERHNRDSIGGGSVSSKLFVGESLVDIEIEGKRAWGTRQISQDYSEDVGFIHKKRKWLIRLFVRRPQHK